MKTWSIQPVATGYELEKPSFGDWVKAGMAFTLGAGIVTLTAVVIWWMMLAGVLFRLGSR